MSDCDDFIDDNAVQEQSDEDIEPTRPTNKTGKRGKDILWIELKSFLTTKEYNDSELVKEISEKFTARIRRETDFADTIRYSCKHARKVGWRACPMMLRVRFLAHCDEVLVEQHGNVHLHEEENDHEHQGVNYRWSDAMTECIIQCLKNEATPAIILRNLKDLNLLPNENGPTRQQLNNKISYSRKILHKTAQIFTTGDLRTKINQHLAVPEDDCEGYIAYYNVDDEHEDDDPRFTIIWTSKKLLSRIKEDLTQDDATYR